jgi:hypothetical protein
LQQIISVFMQNRLSVVCRAECMIFLVETAQLLVGTMQLLVEAT